MNSSGHLMNTQKHRTRHQSHFSLPALPHTHTLGQPLPSPGFEFSHLWSESRSSHSPGPIRLCLLTFVLSRRKRTFLSSAWLCPYSIGVALRRAATPLVSFYSQATETKFSWGDTWSTPSTSWISRDSRVSQVQTRNLFYCCDKNTVAKALYTPRA